VARRSTPRRSNNRAWQLLGVVCLVILGYFLISLSGLVVSQQKLDQQYEVLQSQVAALKAESAELEKEAQWLQTDEALETLAREELGWVKPGETGIVALAPTPTATAATTSSVRLSVGRQPNWERWWNLFFGD